MADETSDNIKSWSIRGVPPEERNAALAAADRSDMNVGEWLRRAIRTQIQQENQANRAPVAVGPVVSDGPTSLSDEALAKVERIAASVRDLAAAGVHPSKTAADRLHNALLKQLPSAGKAQKSDKSAPTSDKLPEASDTAADSG
jgi:hypothetical protein